MVQSMVDRRAVLMVDQMVDQMVAWMVDIMAVC
jgi:hypothetical protein